ncbi:MgtC/SapB family protein [Paenibacillus humicola]|uniref:MgtC/SapB family protein n=1 Tax=Paenibacillus humicola TaxID=3110540 RepID=UPI00237A60EE|nr:MgtC/SapB family protein [Paenibacillus humicola]
MEYEYLLRIVLAGVCGIVIGYERKSRMKEAGIRTHFVVAIGAALMMVVSKYGFGDMTGSASVALDPSRVAAQVVSGIGFLGAGMIFMQRQTVKGLTTAAGLWATAGIGMAIGSGLFVIGIGVTVLIVAAQLLLHSHFSWLATPKTDQLAIRLANEPGAVGRIEQLLRGKDVAILTFHAEKGVSDIQLDITVRMPAGMEAEQLLPLIQDAAFVHTVEVH